MKRIELARKYLKVFFETQGLDELYDLFTDKLDFQGPFLQSNTAEEYIDSLKESPWESCNYEIVEEYENADSVCITYIFKKEKKCALMSQLFWFSEGKISKIRLIFDATDIT